MKMIATRNAIATNEEIKITTAALRANGFAVDIVGTKEEAREIVLGLIPKGSEVFTNTSETLREIGVAEILNGPDYDSARRKMTALAGDPANKTQMKQVAATPEFAIGSAHAVTRDGKLLIASASGSQIPSEAYGADHVIFVVGAQKVVKDLSEGLTRIEKVVVPLEDKRALAAYGGHTAFRKLLVLNSERPGRITVVLVKEALGF